MTEEAKAKDELVDAVLYAIRQGCFFPVRHPKSYRVRDLKKWGAMRHLHDKIATYSKLRAHA